MIDEKNTPPNKPGISDKIALFTDRCIMCSRCVRFTREIAGTAELQVINRGDRCEIDIFPGQPLENELAGNVVDLCPVGALCSKDFLYKQRVWYLKEQESVCADCSTGCSVYVDSNKNVVYRLRPRPNPQAQGDFICDEGRFGFHYVNSAERFRQPLVRSQDALTPTGWPEAIQSIRQELARAATQNAAAIVGVLSPFLTCEEAYLLAKFLKGLSGQVTLALGPVPTIGEDDTFPKNARGEPVQPVKFTIRAQKCPNRRGVEEVLRHFQGETLGFDHVVRGAEEGKFRTIYLAAGYPPRPSEHAAQASVVTDTLARAACSGWIRTEQAASLGKAHLFVVHDLLPSPASELATHVIPAAAWAEKDGTFVNHAGLAQAVRRAVIPAGEFRTDGQVFLDFLERRGLLHAPSLRKELAGAAPYFAPLATEELGEYGISLGA
jgi:NADH-quinone oxidoreductase subunit G